MAITCHLPLCEARIGRGQLMCREHWFMVPLAQRQAVNRTWRAYRSGPAGRIAYFEARDAAILAAATRVGVEGLVEPDAPRFRALQEELEKRR
jgi:hypothetical protein